MIPVLNALAWAVLLVLAGMAILAAYVLGPIGLLLLGVLAWLICSQAALNQDTSTWSEDVFRARLHSRPTPEQREARHAARQDAALPLRFYARCGQMLALAGAAGIALQYWRGI